MKRSTCHLPLLHRFEQRALYLCRRPVDFVREDDVREDRAFLCREASGVLVVDQRADEVGRQQVRSELDALERGADHVGERADGECLCKAGYALEQHVAVAEQPYQQPLDHVFLADEPLSDLRDYAFDKSALPVDGFVKFPDVM
jgi:hypothetical protein